MINHKTRRNNRFRSNGRRNSYRRSDSNGHSNRGSNSMNDGFSRPNSFRGNQNAPRMLEKYTNLAKEALASGDRILSENYFQHADHFNRIISEKADHYAKIASEKVASEKVTSEKVTSEKVTSEKVASETKEPPTIGLPSSFTNKDSKSEKVIQEIQSQQTENKQEK